MPTRQKRNKARSWARYELRRLLLAQGKTQAAHIAQLEREVHLVRERNAELAAQRLEADDRAYYEGRITELEAQRDALLAACEKVMSGVYFPEDWEEDVKAAIAKARGGE